MKDPRQSDVRESTVVLVCRDIELNGEDRKEIERSEAALAQFKLGDSGGADVSGSATLGTSGKQYSLNPYITVYQVSDKGYAVQANWGGTAYLVDPDLN